MGFSSFVSSITSSMAMLRDVRSERTTNESRLRQFFRQHRVCVGLSVRIKRFMKIQYNSRKKRVHEEDIGFFRNLPLSLKIELHEQIFLPIVTLHPLLDLFQRMDYEALS